MASFSVLEVKVIVLVCSQEPIERLFSVLNGGFLLIKKKQLNLRVLFLLIKILYVPVNTTCFCISSILLVGSGLVYVKLFQRNLFYCHYEMS